MSTQQGQFVYACVYRKLIKHKGTAANISNVNHHEEEIIILEDEQNKPEYSIELVAEHYYGLSISTGPGVSQDFAEHISLICNRMVGPVLLQNRIENHGKQRFTFGHLMINCLREDNYLIACTDDVRTRISFEFCNKLQSEFKSISNEPILEEERVKNNGIVSKILTYFNTEYVDPLIKLQQEIERARANCPDRVLMYNRIIGTDNRYGD